MDHLGEAKRVCEWADKAGDANPETVGNAIRLSIAHALIAIAERLDGVTDGDKGRIAVTVVGSVETVPPPSTC